MIKDDYEKKWHKCVSMETPALVDIKEICIHH